MTDICAKPRAAPRLMYNPSMPETNPQQMQPRPHVRGRSWKRTAATALLLLVGGAVVNVAVAWGCLIMLRPQYGWFDFGLWIPTTKARNVDLITASFPEVMIGSSDLDGSIYDDVYGLKVSRFGWVVTEAVFSRFTFEEADSNSIRLDVVTCRAGWPLYSLTGQSDWDGRKSLGRELSYRWAIALPEWMQGGQPNDPWEEYPFLPIQPVFVGFVVNTVFYGSLLWLMICAPFAARRVHRRRRGMCATCAYPVGTSSVCTECGAAVMPHANTPAMSP
jgi:hypothetical protein